MTKMYGRERAGNSMMQRMSAMRRQSNSQLGLTLIETLIVLVILLVGILSVMRLFPSGFGLVRSAANSSIADRLAQDRLETVQTTQGRPDGVYTSFHDASGLLYFDPSRSPTDLTDYGGGLPDAPRMKDINKARFISNETFSVPGGSISAAGVNAAPVAHYPAHLLNFAPIYLPCGTNVNTATILPYLTVNSVDWDQKAANSEHDPNSATATNPTGFVVNRPEDLLGANQAAYLVDYANGRLAVPTEPYDQYFQFIVYVQDSSGAQQTFTASILVPATVTTPSPAGYDGQWFGNPDPAYPTLYSSSTSVPDASKLLLPAGSSWVPGTARLYRPLQYVAPTAFLPTNVPWTADPYQYSIVNDNPAPKSGNAPTDFNAGALCFNPLASGRTVGKPVRVRVSYTTYDWHILHEDHDATPNSVIHLALRELKKVGDVQNDQSVWSGLADANARDNYSLLLVDPDNGVALPYTAASTNSLDDNTPQSGALNVSFTNGRVELPSGPGIDSAYKHLRIFYAGRADWGVALQMAPTSYFPVATRAAVGDATVSGLTPNRYALDPASATIYLPNCDYGKQVVLNGLTYKARVAGGPLVTRSLASWTVNVVNTSGAIGGVQNGSVKIDLNGLGQSDFDPELDPTQPITVRSVQGITARAIVIWRENNRWKQRTLDTALTGS